MGGSLQDGSLTIAGTQRTFDMGSENDVLALLKVVHQNPIDASIKNHLRDLIFTYKQSLSADDLRNVEQGFIPFGIEITAAPAAAVPAASVSVVKREPRQRTLGISRPQPVFTMSAPAKKRVIRTVREGEGVVMPTIHKEMTHAEHTEPKPTAPTAVPADTKPAATSAPEPVQASEPVPASAEPAAVFTGDPTERIKEIKRLVNEKVGNPVNLIETHNELGREYMAALLDAMKKANGGASGGISAAMERLEAAFKNVQDQVLSSPEPLRAQAPKPPQPTALKTEVPTMKEMPPAISAELMSAPKAQTENNAEPHSALSVASAASARETTPKTPMPSVRQQLTQAQTQDSTPTPTPSPAVRQTSESSMHSVAKEKQLQDLLRANREKEILTQKQQEEARVAAMDPLMAPDVDSGLNQLLSEWDLFRKSGFLGTGPKGREHPLFKKLAPLTMAAVIAGRFEGSSTPIKQDIADTMNGWRYAEGIIHEHGETFEHYLRRVVRHILVRQNRK